VLIRVQEESKKENWNKSNQEGKLEQATTTDARLPAEDVHVITGHRNWKIATGRGVFAGVGNLLPLWLVRGRLLSIGRDRFELNPPHVRQTAISVISGEYIEVTLMDCGSMG